MAKPSSVAITFLQDRNSKRGYMPKAAFEKLGQPEYIRIEIDEFFELIRIYPAGRKTGFKVYLPRNNFYIPTSKADTYPLGSIPLKWSEKGWWYGKLPKLYQKTKKTDTETQTNK